MQNNRLKVINITLKINMLTLFLLVHLKDYSKDVFIHFQKRAKKIGPYGEYCLWDQ